MDLQYLADINAERAMSLCVVVAEFRHRGDGIESCILRQREWNDVQSLGERADTVLLHSSQSLWVFQQADC